MKGLFTSDIGKYPCAGDISNDKRLYAKDIALDEARDGLQTQPQDDWLHYVLFFVIGVGFYCSEQQAG